MPESFGVRLRQQRERQQIALATIAERTKIKLSLLEELEHDNVSHWPSGIFRRAFFRAYAHAIGLDQDVVIREFLEVYPDPDEVVETAATVAPGTNGGSATTAPPTRLQYLLGAAMGSLNRYRRPTVEKRDLAVENVAAVDRPAGPPAPAVDLPDVARLCTEFARLDETSQAAPLLDEVAGLLDAVGLIVWVWDPKSGELKPALAHGYSDRVLAQLPRVRREADNATAAAFRSAQTGVVRGGDRASGALVVPLITPLGCIGVFAVELKGENEQRPAVRALATIVAAQLARLIAAAQPAEAANRKLA